MKQFEKLLNTRKYKIHLINKYETFCPIADAQGYYISSYGRFGRLVNDVWELINPHKNKAGESLVNVLYDGQQTETEELVALLVARAYLAPMGDDYNYVWYKDNDKNNLWCKNLFLLREEEYAEVLKNPDLTKKLARRQKVCSWYNFNHHKLDQLWRDMMRRCYDRKYLDRHPEYVGYYVCDDWRAHREKFFEWVRTNFYDFPAPLDLDKDIRSIYTKKKEYCPENCCFLPHNINMIFQNVKRKNSHAGITEKEKRRDGSITYVVSMTASGEGRGRTKSYQTLEKAQESYKRNKIAMIHKCYEIARFENLIPSHIGDAIQEWQKGIENGTIEVTSGLTDTRRK